MFASIVALSLLPVAALAAPTLDIQARQATPHALTNAQINAFTPYSYLAGAAYCNVAQTLAWTCGTNCLATPQFQPTASGGVGSKQQSWFVGYYPPTKEVIVSYQGTDKKDLSSVLTDINFFLKALPVEQFPTVDATVQTHEGFAESFAPSAAPILDAVHKTLAAHPNSTVVVTGHSLGGAVSEIAAVWLKQQLGTATFVHWIGYSTPRVGNADWADLVDSTVDKADRIVNNHDMVSIIPGRHLGFAHPNGEIHIDTSGSGKWLSCPGQDSTSPGCMVDSTPSIFSSSLFDHPGPFNGVKLSSSRCDA